MRIIFSRKGFDSGSGGKPSPIIDGVPVSLPIPGARDEPFTYGDLFHPTAGSLSKLTEEITKGRITAGIPAHYDPQLPWEHGIASLGQQGAAQTHLLNQSVTVGDVIIFFGLFRDYTAPRGHPNAKPHHRIFGAMTIDRLCILGEEVKPGAWRDLGLPQPHPHTERKHSLVNNAIWIGQGQLAHHAGPDLRLSQTGAAPSHWNIPCWLTRCGLSYHASPDRWSGSQLRLVARGQEFVSDVGQDSEALSWIANIQNNLSSPSSISA
jgi:hypothetical protein